MHTSNNGGTNCGSRFHVKQTEWDSCGFLRGGARRRGKPRLRRQEAACRPTPSPIHSWQYDSEVRPLLRRQRRPRFGQRQHHRRRLDPRTARHQRARPLLANRGGPRRCWPQLPCRKPKAKQSKAKPPGASPTRTPSRTLIGWSPASSPAQQDGSDRACVEQEIRLTDRDPRRLSIKESPPAAPPPTPCSRTPPPPPATPDSGATSGAPS